MAEDSTPRFSDEEASRIWRRAAELQARRRLPALAEREEGGESQHPTAESHLSSEEIVAIAREAGIDPEFIDQALTEARVSPLPEQGEKYSLQTRRQIDAPLPLVQDALQEVAARQPFRLRLVDMEPVSEARVLTFDLGADASALNAGQITAAPNLVAVRVLLRAADTSSSTELILHGVPNPNLFRSVKRHDISYGTVGALGGGAAGFFGAGALAISAPFVFAALAAGAAALSAGGVGLNRWTQNWAHRRDAASLEQLADETVGAVRIRKHSAQLPPA